MFQHTSRASKSFYLRLKRFLTIILANLAAVSYGKVFSTPLSCVLTILYLGLIFYMSLQNINTYLPLILKNQKLTASSAELEQELDNTE